MSLGQYDNDTDPLVLYPFQGVQEWLLVNLPEVPEEQMRMKLVLNLVMKFLLWTWISQVKKALVEEWVEDVKIQRTSCKQAVEV